MKVVITGAGGQLGRDLVRVFSREELRPLNHAELDVADFYQVRQLVGEFRPDLIVHAAALTDVDRAEREPDLAYRVNALGTKNLALVARRTGARLVYISTDYVFSGEKAEPYLEFDPVSPVNHYGASKLAGEMLVREIWPEHYIVRTSWVFGAGGRGNFLQAILRLAAERNRLQVVNDQVGSPTYTRDLASAIRELVERPTYGTYHLSNSGSCSRYELAQELVRLADLPAEVEPVDSAAFPRPARRPLRTPLRNLMWELEGHMPLPPWPRAVAEYLAEL